MGYLEGMTLKMETHPPAKKEVPKFVISNLAIGLMYGVISKKKVNQRYLQEYLSLTGRQMRTSRSNLCATGKFLIKKKKKFVYT